MNMGTLRMSHGVLDRRGSGGRRPPPRTSRAFTLAESVTALAVFSILMLGVGAALSIAVRALDTSSSPAAWTARTAGGLSQMGADLAVATSFSVRAPTAVEFTVPDRTGDDVPDTIRYAWSGATDAPLTRTINGGTPHAVASAIGALALRYGTRTVVSRTTTSSTSTTSGTLASFTGWSGVPALVYDYKLTNSAWAAEYVALDAGLFPEDGGAIDITRVTLELKQINGPAGTITVGIYRAVGGGDTRPSATLLGTPVTVSNATLKSDYTSVHFDFNDVKVSPADREIVIYVKASGGSAGTAYLRYLYSVSAPADSTIMRWTSDGGSNWSPSNSLLNQNDLAFTLVGGTTTTPSRESLLNTYFLDTVSVSIAPPATGGDPLETTVLVLASPQVSSP
jgi:hypothetical protein